jgi:hypothetical protein
MWCGPPSGPATRPRPPKQAGYATSKQPVITFAPAFAVGIESA